MSTPFHPYGSLEPIEFVIANTSGVGQTGVTFSAGDVYTILDSGTAVDVSAKCSEVSNGIYKYTPTLASETQAKSIWLVFVKTGYAENRVNIVTGGGPSAFHTGS